MGYNKSHYRKVNDKKVLHKSNKHWIVVSVATLRALGRTGFAIKRSSNVSQGSSAQAAQQTNNHSFLAEQSAATSRLDQAAQRAANSYYVDPHQQSSQSERSESSVSEAHSGRLTSQNAHLDEQRYNLAKSLVSFDEANHVSNASHNKRLQRLLHMGTVQSSDHQSVKSARVSRESRNSDRSATPESSMTSNGLSRSRLLHNTEVSSSSSSSRPILHTADYIRSYFSAVDDLRADQARYAIDSGEVELDNVTGIVQDRNDLKHLVAENRMVFDVSEADPAEQAASYCDASTASDMAAAASSYAANADRLAASVSAHAAHQGIANVTTASEFNSAVQDANVRYINVMNDLDFWPLANNKARQINIPARNLSINGQLDTKNAQHLRQATVDFASFCYSFGHKSNGYTLKLNNIHMFGTNAFGPFFDYWVTDHQAFVYDNVTYDGAQLNCSLGSQIVFMGNNAINTGNYSPNGKAGRHYDYDAPAVPGYHITDHASPLDKSQAAPKIAWIQGRQADNLNDGGNQQAIECADLKVAPQAHLDVMTWDSTPINLNGLPKVQSTIDFSKDSVTHLTPRGADGERQLLKTADSDNVYGIAMSGVDGHNAINIHSGAEVRITPAASSYQTINTVRSVPGAVEIAHNVHLKIADHGRLDIDYLPKNVTDYKLPGDVIQLASGSVLQVASGGSLIVNSGNNHQTPESGVTIFHLIKDDARLELDQGSNFELVAGSSKGFHDGDITTYYPVTLLDAPKGSVSVNGPLNFALDLRHNENADSKLLATGSQLNAYNILIYGGHGDQAAWHHFDKAVVSSNSKTNYAESNGTRVDLDPQEYDFSDYLHFRAPQRPSSAHAHQHAKTVQHVNSVEDLDVTSARPVSDSSSSSEVSSRTQSESSASVSVSASVSHSVAVSSVQASSAVSSRAQVDQSASKSSDSALKNQLSQAWSEFTGYYHIVKGVAERANSSYQKDDALGLSGSLLHQHLSQKKPIQNLNFKVKAFNKAQRLIEPVKADIYRHATSQSSTIVQQIYNFVGNASQAAASARSTDQEITSTYSHINDQIHRAHDGSLSRSASAYVASASDYQSAVAQAVNGTMIVRDRTAQFQASLKDQQKSFASNYAGLQSVSQKAASQAKELAALTLVPDDQTLKTRITSQINSVVRDAEDCRSANSVTQQRINSYATIVQDHAGQRTLRDETSQAHSLVTTAQQRSDQITELLSNSAWDSARDLNSQTAELFEHVDNDASVLSSAANSGYTEIMDQKSHLAKSSARMKKNYDRTNYLLTKMPDQFGQGLTTVPNSASAASSQARSYVDKISGYAAHDYRSDVFSDVNSAALKSTRRNSIKTLNVGLGIDAARVSSVADQSAFVKNGLKKLDHDYTVASNAASQLSDTCDQYYAYSAIGKTDRYDQDWRRIGEAVASTNVTAQSMSSLVNVISRTADHAKSVHDRVEKVYKAENFNTSEAVASAYYELGKRYSNAVHDNVDVLYSRASSAQVVYNNLNSMDTAVHSVSALALKYRSECSSALDSLASIEKQDQMIDGGLSVISAASSTDVSYASIVDSNLAVIKSAVIADAQNLKRSRHEMVMISNNDAHSFLDHAEMKAARLASAVNSLTQRTVDINNDDSGYRAASHYNSVADRYLNGMNDQVSNHNDTVTSAYSGLMDIQKSMDRTNDQMHQIADRLERDGNNVYPSLPQPMVNVDYLDVNHLNAELGSCSKVASRIAASASQALVNDRSALSVGSDYDDSAFESGQAAYRGNRLIYHELTSVQDTFSADFRKLNSYAADWQLNSGSERDYFDRNHHSNASIMATASYDVDRAEYLMASAAQLTASASSTNADAFYRAHSFINDNTSSAVADYYNSNIQQLADDSSTVPSLIRASASSLSDSYDQLSGQGYDIWAREAAQSVSMSQNAFDTALVPYRSAFLKHPYDSKVAQVYQTVASESVALGRLYVKTVKGSIYNEHYMQSASQNVRSAAWAASDAQQHDLNLAPVADSVASYTDLTLQNVSRGSFDQARMMNQSASNAFKLNELTSDASLVSVASAQGQSLVSGMASYNNDLDDAIKTLDSPSWPTLPKENHTSSSAVGVALSSAYLKLSKATATMDSEHRTFAHANQLTRTFTALVESTAAQIHSGYDRITNGFQAVASVPRFLQQLTGTVDDYSQRVTALGDQDNSAEFNRLEKIFTSAGDRIRSNGDDLNRSWHANRYLNLADQLDDLERNVDVVTSAVDQASLSVNHVNNGMYSAWDAARFVVGRRDSAVSATIAGLATAANESAGTRSIQQRSRLAAKRSALKSTAASAAQKFTRHQDRAVRHFITSTANYTDDVMASHAHNSQVVDYISGYGTGLINQTTISAEQSLMDQHIAKVNSVAASSADRELTESIDRGMTFVSGHRAALGSADEHRLQGLFTSMAASGRHTITKQRNLAKITQAKFKALTAINGLVTSVADALDRDQLVTQIQSSRAQGASVASLRDLSTASDEYRKTASVVNNEVVSVSRMISSKVAGRLVPNSLVVSADSTLKSFTESMNQAASSSASDIMKAASVAVTNLAASASRADSAMANSYDQLPDRFQTSQIFNSAVAAVASNNASVLYSAGWTLLLANDDTVRTFNHTDQSIIYRTHAKLMNRAVAKTTRLSSQVNAFSRSISAQIYSQAHEIDGQITLADQQRSKASSQVDSAQSDLASASVQTSSLADLVSDKSDLKNSLVASNLTQIEQQSSLTNSYGRQFKQQSQAVESCGIAIQSLASRTSSRAAVISSELHRNNVSKAQTLINRTDRLTSHLSTAVSQLLQRVDRVNRLARQGRAAVAVAKQTLNDLTNLASLTRDTTSQADQIVDDANYASSVVASNDDRFSGLISTASSFASRTGSDVTSVNAHHETSAINKVVSDVDYQQRTIDSLVNDLQGPGSKVHATYVALASLNSSASSTAFHVTRALAHGQYSSASSEISHSRAAVIRALGRVKWVRQLTSSADQITRKLKNRSLQLDRAIDSADHLVQKESVKASLSASASSSAKASFASSSAQASKARVSASVSASVSTSESLSISASVSVSASTSASLSNRDSLRASASLSASASASLSLSANESASTSVSLSQSASKHADQVASASVSAAKLSQAQAQSKMQSLKNSRASSSASLSESISASVSASFTSTFAYLKATRWNRSVSTSQSLSAQASLSQSASLSASSASVSSSASLSAQSSAEHSASLKSSSVATSASRAQSLLKSQAQSSLRATEYTKPLSFIGSTFSRVNSVAYQASSDSNEISKAAVTILSQGQQLNDPVASSVTTQVKANVETADHKIGQIISKDKSMLGKIASQADSYKSQAIDAVAQSNGSQVDLIVNRLGKDAGFVNSAATLITRAAAQVKSASSGMNNLASAVQQSLSNQDSTHGEHTKGAERYNYGYQRNEQHAFIQGINARVYGSKSHYADNAGAKKGYQEVVKYIRGVDDARKGKHPAKDSRFNSYYYTGYHDFVTTYDGSGHSLPLSAALLMIIDLAFTALDRIARRQKK